MDQPDTESTRVEVVYPPHKGAIGLRGSRAPLSWDETFPPTSTKGERLAFEFEIPLGEVLEIKLVRGEDDWAQGRNYTIHAGEDLCIEPYFDSSTSILVPSESIDTEAGSLQYQVLLPPSYNEQESKRYPVLYAQDGQSLWSTSEDPFGNWALEATFDQLYELGAIEEVILVAIDTSRDRTDRLSPVADPEHGGGFASKHLEMMTGPLRHAINSRYRTKTGRGDTALLGSSMGGLFSFYAAWSRSDVFGKAACLSSSFWWADRQAIRQVQTSKPPSPKPLFYLDSGAALWSFEKDANVRDGYNHTRSMLRALFDHGFTPGVDVHKLTFAGSTHDAASWASRVSIPLQILFPPKLGQRRQSLLSLHG